MSGAEYNRRGSGAVSFFCYTSSPRKRGSDSRVRGNDKRERGNDGNRKKKELQHKLQWFSAVKALFAGFRGGNWNNDATNARVSDRNNAANTNANRNNNNGARLAKTSFVVC